MIDLGMPCFPVSYTGVPNRQAGTRSMHMDGVFVCMVDGSIQYVSDNIEVGTYNASIDLVTLGVWDRLCLVNDGEVVGDAGF